MFASTEPVGLAEADALARHGDGVVVDVSRLFGKASIETGLLEALLAGAPGPELVAVLAAVEEGPLTEGEAVTVAQTWERVGRWVAARQHTANLRLAGPAPDRTGSSEHLDLGVEEVRVGLGLSAGQADLRVAMARALATRLPLTAAALEAGEISTGHVAVLVDLTGDRCAEVAAKVEDHVLIRAAHQSVAAFKRCVRRALVRFDPLGEALTHLQAAARGDVVRFDHPDTGLTTILATLPVLDGAIVWNTLDACARRDRTHDKSRSTTQNQGSPAPGDPAPDDATAAGTTDGEPVVKTLGAYRADTLVRWAAGGPRPHRGAAPATPPGRGPARDGRCPPRWAWPITPPRSPATGRCRPRSPGFSPTTPTGGAWSPTPSPATSSTTATPPTNPPGPCATTSSPATGHAPPRTANGPPPTPSSTTPTPSPARTANPTLAASDRPEHTDRTTTATQPTQPDRQGQHDQGGTTSSANLRTECTWHHLLKTHHGWTAQPRPDGSTLWTSPAGRTYLIPPTPVLPA